LNIQRVLILWHEALSGKKKSRREDDSFGIRARMTKGGQEPDGF
jgi:hypothetical protein